MLCQKNQQKNQNVNNKKTKKSILYIASFSDDVKE